MTIPLRLPLPALDGLVGAFDRLDDTHFAGYALDPNDPMRRLVVEIVVDGEPVALLRAEGFDRRTLQGGFGDGCYGFLFKAEPRVIAGQRTIEARLANEGTRIGRPLNLTRQPVSKSAGAARTGTVLWNSGLRLFGTARLRDPARPPVVRVRDGGDVIAEIRPRRWIPARDHGLAPDRCPFSLHLPATYADGQIHRFRVEDETGLELEGSPLAILTFADGLAASLAPEQPSGDELRAEWFDRICPGSLPFHLYPTLRDRSDRPVPTSPGSVRVVLVGERGVEGAVERLKRQTLSRWSAACIGAEAGAFAPDDLREAATGDLGEEDVVVFLGTNVVLIDGALAILAEALRAAPEAEAAYGDVEVAIEGRVAPIYFGAFDYERQLEQGYAAQAFAVRLSSLGRAWRVWPASLPRLLLALLEDDASVADRILHCPGVLARIEPAADTDAEVVRAATADHLAARGVPAHVAVAAGVIFPAIRVRRVPHPGMISIVVPTRDRLDLLETCIASIRAHTVHTPYEIVVVDNGSSEPATHAFLRALADDGGRVVDCPGAFNYAKLNNAGVAAASGSRVCLLNNDTQILDGTWLAELASRMEEPDVGAVGALLRWPNGVVQHGGVVLGPGFSAADAFNDCLVDDPGYGDLLRVAHEVSAATAACLLVRRDAYLALGGFDEIAFPVLFNDVDFCLRLRAQGRRVVLTPHAHLLHHESASRGRDEAPSRRGRYHRELAALRRRWGEALAADPAYSPFLNLDTYPFSALAAAPRAAVARTRHLPLAGSIPPIAAARTRDGSLKR